MKLIKLVMVLKFFYFEFEEVTSKFLSLNNNKKAEIKM